MEAKLTIALAGNPNVGKSTVFNQLTGLKQHTGNWPGKTVANAQGYYSFQDKGYVLVDIPGCYSLMALSAEEEVARDFICFQSPDAVVVVCDATCLERNMNLVLQILEVTNKVVVCINLMDEANKKAIRIDTKTLQERLGVPVVETVARKKVGLKEVMFHIQSILEVERENRFVVPYPDYVEEKISLLEAVIKKVIPEYQNSRWLAARLLDGDENMILSIRNNIHIEDEEFRKIEEIKRVIEEELFQENILNKQWKDDMATSFIKAAEELCKDIITHENTEYSKQDRRLDYLFTSKLTGFPIMFLVLMGIFWLTITGANYPSTLLSNGLFWIEGRIYDLCLYAGIPELIYEPLLFGIWRVSAWVVSVMLPPMAIFFPLFTILEDFGFLPRVAFNLDRCFKRCSACGKQALTMAMGFGCNAAGVTGCRIIDSPRERLIAILTNNFVPCNGRFPTLIAIASMFFIGVYAGGLSSLYSALVLAGIILLGILMTLAISWILSKTLLKGVPSSFTLELPSYRRPQIGKVIIRSIFDRTLFVLGRAVAVAMPAGLIIWILANIQLNNGRLLNYCSDFLDPFAKFIGLDGVILLAFILGFPANEIVIPIIIMIYMSEGSLLEINDLKALKQLFIDHGWTRVTAISTILFSLFHWPCSTTCLTIKKETQSKKWTLLSIIIPTITGLVLCAIYANIARLF